jgi:hypothetical protein
MYVAVWSEALGDNRGALSGYMDPEAVSKV